MLNRVWTLSSRNEFAEKLCKKTGGAFLNFPRFAAAHCRDKQKRHETSQSLGYLSVQMKVNMWSKRALNVG